MDSELKKDPGIPRLPDLKERKRNVAKKYQQVSQIISSRTDDRLTCSRSLLEIQILLWHLNPH